MTISSRVRQEFRDQEQQQQQLIRIPQTKCHTSSSTVASSVIPSSSHSQKSNGLWTHAEHERFLQALELFPHGPWKHIATYIGNKTARQAMCHAQKYRQKIARRKRGLQVNQYGGRLTVCETNDAAGPAPTKASHQKQTPTQEASHGQPPSIPKSSPVAPVKVSNCPKSPSEVSSLSTDELMLSDLTQLLSSQAFESYSQRHQPQQQHLVNPFGPVVRFDHQQANSPSFLDLLLEDDHEMLLNTMNEVIDSLEEKPVDSQF